MSHPDAQSPVTQRNTVDQPTRPDTQARLPPGDVFEMLSNARRRHVVHYLLQHDETVTLRALSRQIAAWENNVAPEDVTSKQRKRVYTALHQSHLPKLDECGVIDFNDDRSLITPTERVSDLQVYLEVVPDNEIPWSVYYTGLGLFSASLLAAKTIGLFPFSELSGLAWAVLIVLLYTASALGHLYHTRQMKLGGEGPPPEFRVDRPD